jgi:hypothetical protein
MLSTTYATQAPQEEGVRKKAFGLRSLAAELEIDAGNLLGENARPPVVDPCGAALSIAGRELDERGVATQERDDDPCPGIAGIKLGGAPVGGQSLFSQRANRQGLIWRLNHRGQCGRQLDQRHTIAKYGGGLVGVLRLSLDQVREDGIGRRSL